MTTTLTTLQALRRQEDGTLERTELYRTELGLYADALAASCDTEDERLREVGRTQLKGWGVLDGPATVWRLEGVRTEWVLSALDAEIRHRLESGSTPADVASELGLDLVDDAVCLPGWTVSLDGANIYYPDAQSAAEASAKYVEDGDWDDEPHTSWVDLQVWSTGYWLDEDGDAEEVKVAWQSHTTGIEPREPECSGDEHDWQAPYEVVGGIEDNPGCWASGGGVVYTEVCAHCGTYRVTDTWAQRPDTGEQGLRSVEYREADAVSLAWIWPRRLEQVEAAYTAAAGKWTGCDWTTATGQGLEWDLDSDDPEVLRAAHDAIARGEQPEGIDHLGRGSLSTEQYLEALRSAYEWLEQVEADARAAEEYGELAIEAAREGNLQEALEYAEQACALEREYGDDPTWGDLRRAIEDLVEEDAGV